MPSGTDNTGQSLYGQGTISSFAEWSRIDADERNIHFPFDFQNLEQKYDVGDAVHDECLIALEDETQ